MSSIKTVWWGGDQRPEHGATIEVTDARPPGTVAVTFMFNVPHDLLEPVPSENGTYRLDYDEALQRPHQIFQ